MGLCFAIASGKGGTGKSTTAVSLAYAFSALGRRVLLVDLDEGLRCLDIMLGIDDRIIFDIGDVIAGREITDAIYSVPDTGISLIPASDKPERLDRDSIAEVIKKAAGSFDITIADMPAGIDTQLNMELSDTVNSFIVVCNPDPVSIRDAASAGMNLTFDGKRPRLIINRFNSKMIKNGIYANIDSMIDASGIQLAGIIPQSEDLMLLSVNHRLKRACRAQKAAGRIAERLSGKNIPLPKPKNI